jgi:predicted ABC-type transport system involved in lysophospholipase L1 biosynthesis ATPase subunit
VHALDGVSLAVGRGDCVAIMGPSGSGKSTLLHVLCGLDRPTSGRVSFDGREPKPGEWDRLRAERIGFVFQAFHLLPTLTAAENVEVPMFGTGRSRREREERARELLRRVGLADRATHLPRELSGGECQRVAIARSLANEPDVLLADEPTGNLDSKSSAEILDLLFDIHARDGATLVIVTHEAAIAERAGRIVHLLDGRVVSQGVAAS